ncbi:tandem-95 repeat protein [Limibaculum sp. FT325]|uniref:Ig-like domain-containing protein n=1 Tax=Thermohalobaculum sediminis TaxID=2939436 RepID=UPI0020C0D73D|nr:tandem-95 repeat protein [Limibaculum sediminis]MCL5775929.1 tandem-95 repeat protein [Limibaculum sediminis]
MPKQEKGARAGSGAGTTVLSGTDGDDTLEGFGGSFRLEGQDGNDLYRIDDEGDAVVERRNRGTDTVEASITYTLPNNVENLVLTGAADIDGTGNGDDNVITGNSGANTLTGLGGADTLSGGAGDDLIDGGDGEDWALFEGLSSDYRIALLADGSVQVVHAATGETDRLIGIERLVFADGSFAPDALTGQPLVARDDTGATLEDRAAVFDVLGNDDGTGLTLVSVSGGTMGTASVNADGTIAYRPDADAWGTDTLTYEVVDATGQRASATLTVTVAAVNDAPIAADDAAQVVAGQSVTIGVLANDSDPDGDGLAVLDAGGAAGGTLSIGADGRITYTASASFSGSDSFTYTVSDGNGGTASATVSVSVASAEPAPAPEEPAPAPAPAPEEMPYYVAALLEDTYRMNYPDAYGTADTVTFAFLTEVPAYYGTGSWAENGFQAFSEQQQEATRAVLESITGFANITFIEVTNPEEADITFGLADLGGGAWALSPSSDGIGTQSNDIWLDATAAGDTFVAGSWIYSTLLHETGHVLGMDHISSTELPSDENNRQHSVMSANKPISLSVEPQTYMLYDIATLQYIYGTNTDTATGNDVYGFAELNTTLMTIWDGGGHDTIDLSAATFGVSIDLREGAFSSVASRGQDTLAIAFGTVIEDAIGGAYADLITGNESANRLTGNGGADTFQFAANWGDDVIADFTRGEDLLDFSLAGLGFGDLTITSSGGDTILSHGADSVVLEGVSSLGQGDFVLA